MQSLTRYGRRTLTLGMLFCVERVTDEYMHLYNLDATALPPISTLRRMPTLGRCRQERTQLAKKVDSEYYHGSNWLATVGLSSLFQKGGVEPKKKFVLLFLEKVLSIFVHCGQIRRILYTYSNIYSVQLSCVLVGFDLR